MHDGDDDGWWWTTHTQHRIAEVTVGDETGTIILRARDGKCLLAS